MSLTVNSSPTFLAYTAATPALRRPSSAAPATGRDQAVPSGEAPSGDALSGDAPSGDALSGIPSSRCPCAPSDLRVKSHRKAVPATAPEAESPHRCTALRRWWSRS